MSSPYANIRGVLGRFIGQKLVEITQHDQEEWKAGKEAYVCLMFDSGNTITFPITDLGFEHTEEEEEAPAT
jgi:hypothetical protein